VEYADTFYGAPTFEDDAFGDNGRDAKRFADETGDFALAAWASAMRCVCCALLKARPGNIRAV
jgi:hypothetical protein